MKLYNLYIATILEEVFNGRLLTENIYNDIIDAIEKKYNVRITYKDYMDDPKTTKRYIQIYDLGDSKAGNTMISAYQLGGETENKAGQGVYGWKQFRLDKIVDIEKTNVKFKNPVSDFDPTIPKYNKTGNKNMRKIIKKIKI